MEVKLPNLGDGIESAVVLDILVSIGDSVDAEQSLLELETDKAVAPVPSPSAGKVEKIHIKVGETVATGQLVISLSGADTSSTPAKEDTSSTTPQVPKPTPPQLLTASPTINYQAPSSDHVVSSPWIRKIAAQIGLDLTRVAPTGPNNRITIDDVKTYMAALQSNAFTSQSTTAPVESQKPKSPLPDFSKWGKIKKEKLSSLRIKIGDKMSESWTTIPHVTQYDNADITDVMAHRKKHNDKYKTKGANLTITAIAIKVAVNALKNFPVFNSSFDDSTGELIQKQYYHIGVAVDTDNGLIVPVIRDADQKSLFELAKEIGDLASKARDRKVSLDELQGATFTISNLGGLGVGAFTPIVNHPEVAILGMGRGVKQPVYNSKGNLESRLIEPLALSYDHRIIDGADGARFMRTLVDGFENFEEKEIKL